MELQSSLADAATAAASTTPTSRSTAASRSSPASSRAASRRSTWSNRKVLGYLKLSKGGMPQDIRISPDGKHVLRRRHDGRRRLRRRRRDASRRSASSRPASARTASIRAATARSSTSPTAARTTIHGMPSGKGSVSVVDFATQQGRRQLADPRRRQPRHGQRQRRRQDAVAVGPLRQRRLRVRHDDAARSPRSRSARSRTASPCGRSRAATRSGHTGNMR